MAKRIAQNLKAIRGSVSLRELSTRLRDVGRPILPSGLLGIEKETRRVDVDDLVALALALGVDPNRLLLSERADAEPIDLTPTVRVSRKQAWSWANGQSPLLVMETDKSRPYREVRDEFLERARPKQASEQHTAIRAAEVVIDRIHLVLNQVEALQEEPPLDEAAQAEYRRAREDAKATLLRALKRLIAEVEDLTETDLESSGASRG